MEANTRFIVGLGNPGKDYERTRHNVGFMVVDAFVKSHGLSWKHEPVLRSMVAEGNIDGAKTILVKPTTYMNASGEAVRLVVDRFHLPLSAMLVISDDVDLPLGNARYRTEGGAGGHNGLKSLIACLGTQEFARLKIGISAPPERIPLEEYVLERFMKEEHGVIDRVVAKMLEVLDSSSPLQETTWTV
ncbi:MAG: aminoacyl-tRNA hydrolase [Patescibacteria group bacterium]|jgi:PTH1 family peptidyl-tRNA hydrolase